jgi:hypothetical protein
VADLETTGLIPCCYQDETKYGMLRVVTDDRSERWQDLDR